MKNETTKKTILVQITVEGPSEEVDRDINAFLRIRNWGNPTINSTTFTEWSLKVCDGSSDDKVGELKRLVAE